jgi:hypothetical protein
MNVRTSAVVAIAIAVWLISPTRVVAKDIEFSATIAEITITKRFDKDTIVTGLDPRFRVRLTLDQDVEGIGKSGDSVSFLVHSLARDLKISDQRAAVGSRISWKLGRKEGSDMLYLQRAGKNEDQQDVPLDGKKPSIEAK